MSNEQHQNEELTLEVALVPGLATAISEWYAARHRFQIERVRQHRDDYNKTTDELGQAFSQWQAEQPDLFEQFRFWFRAHQED